MTEDNTIELELENQKLINALTNATILNTELADVIEAWRQIAIRERAKVIAVIPLIPEPYSVCPERYYKHAAEVLDEEIKDIIIAEEGDSEALVDLSKIIELLKEGRTPAMMEEDLVRVEAAVKRWLKRLGGQP